MNNNNNKMLFSGLIALVFKMFYNYLLIKYGDNSRKQHILY